MKCCKPSDIQHSAKNIVLAGVKSVTIYDPEPVIVRDLSSQASNSVIYSSSLLTAECFSSSSVKRILESHEPQLHSPASPSLTHMSLYGILEDKLVNQLLLT